MGVDGFTEVLGTDTRVVASVFGDDTFHMRGIGGKDGNDIIGLDDPFGSLISDISGDEFKKLGYNLGDKIAVQLNKKPVTLPYVKTFMDVPVGELLLYVDSRGRVGLAVNERNFSVAYKITPPVPLFIPKKGTPIKGK